MHLWFPGEPGGGRKSHHSWASPPSQPGEGPIVTPGVLVTRGIHWLPGDFTGYQGKTMVTREIHWLPGESTDYQGGAGYQGISLVTRRIHWLPG